MESINFMTLACNVIRHGQSNLLVMVLFLSVHFSNNPYKLAVNKYCFCIRVCRRLNFIEKQSVNELERDFDVFVEFRL